MLNACHILPRANRHFRRLVRLGTYIECQGYRILRYWSNGVLKDIDGVLDDIQRAITTTPTPNSSPQGGGE